MTDYGHDLLFGVAAPPDAREHRAVLDLVAAAERFGLDLAAFQDHPYQPGFLDTWTLLSYVAARTERIRLLPDVANVPLRPPAVLARSAAALDLLSGGRVELGLGAGYFLDAIVSMGGPRRSMAEHVAALDEAIAVIRSLWRPGGPVTLRGAYYQLEGARPGPVPAHPIGIWLGAYKRRMLELTGRAADAWIPSLGYASPADLGRMSRTIDAAAEAAGRDPSAIRRAFNVSGAFSRSGSGFLRGSPADWAAQLAELTLEHGMSAFVLGADPQAAADVERFARDVAPAVREIVAGERRRGERRRAAAPQPPADVGSEVGREGRQALLLIHNHLRQELAKLRDVLDQVAAGRASAVEARSYLGEMTMRQNSWTLGAFCAAYCRVVSVHHAIEDEQMFPDLRAADQSLAPVLERLRREHEGIAALLDEVDRALVAMVEREGDVGEPERAVERLSDVLLAHLRYEEDQLLGAIERLGIRV